MPRVSLFGTHGWRCAQDAFNVNTPVRYATSSALHSTVQDANAAEAEAIRRRLEGLGYL